MVNQSELHETLGNGVTGVTIIESLNYIGEQLEKLVRLQEQKLKEGKE